VISPADVSSSTDMMRLIFPTKHGWIDGSEVAVDLFRVQARWVEHEIALDVFGLRQHVERL
jgi:hypothetical protein